MMMVFAGALVFGCSMAYTSLVTLNVPNPTFEQTLPNLKVAMLGLVCLAVPYLIWMRIAALLMKLEQRE